jgi:polyisoprenoid-binding protein YceI
MPENASSVATTTARYDLDAARSSFTVQAFAGGLLAGFGHNPLIGIRDFTGQVDFTSDDLSRASVRIEIDPGSLLVQGEVKESDKAEINRTMLDQVLEVSRFPEIVFQSTKVTVTRIVEGRYKAQIVGNLTLHGVTREAPWILAQVTLQGNELRARAEFALKQTDYQIKPVSVAGGALKVKDELKFNFDLLAVGK